MNWLELTILGIVQGITEFLPVSSSGHLVVLQALFEELKGQKLGDVLEINILLHAGTLAAILVFYWRQIVDIIRTDRRVIGLLVVGTIPAVIVGLPLKIYAEHLLQNPLLTGFMLIATGSLLIWSGRRRDGELDMVEISHGQAFLIGIFQALALLPGISRSGWTIGGGLLLGVKRESATTFSFLLAIPAIIGATMLEMKDLVGRDGGGTPGLLLALGTSVAFVVGLISLWGLVKIVQRGRLAWFAWWCIPLGIAVIVWQQNA